MLGKENFFTNVLVASLRHESKIATEAERAIEQLIEQLTVKQVVAWFVKDGKSRTEQETDGAFLDL